MILQSLNNPDVHITQMKPAKLSDSYKILNWTDTNRIILSEKQKISFIIKCSYVALTEQQPHRSEQKCDVHKSKI